MEDLTKVFKALSDPNRIRILKMLESRALCLCEISFILSVANSTASQHLSILKEAGLVIDDKDGKWVNYALTAASASVYVNELMPLIKKWLIDDKTIKADRKKIEAADRKILCS